MSDQDLAAFLSDWKRQQEEAERRLRAIVAGRSSAATPNAKIPIDLDDDLVAALETKTLVTWQDAALIHLVRRHPPNAGFQGGESNGNES